MSGIGADPELRVGKSLHCLAANLHVLAIALAGNPEDRRLDELELRRREHGRREMAECVRELLALVVFFTPLEHVSAEHLLRVPRTHQRRPLLGFESPRPFLIARAARGVRRIQSGGDDDRRVEAAALQEIEREAPAHRVAEEHLAFDIARKKVEVRDQSEEAGKDHEHRASYFSHTLRDASASGRSSTTSMFHILAHCSNVRPCSFSMMRARSCGSSVRSEATRPKMRPPPLLMTTMRKRASSCG